MKQWGMVASGTIASNVGARDDGAWQESFNHGFHAWEWDLQQWSPRFWAFVFRGAPRNRVEDDPALSGFGDDYTLRIGCLVGDWFAVPCATYSKNFTL